MTIFDKIKSFCISFRIILGISILMIGYLLGDGGLNLGWWYLGLIPLIAGITKFCPICIITKKCSIR
jgi:hypothetical protein